MSQIARCTFAFCMLAIAAPPAFAAEVVRLNAENWDAYAPQGKEVDANYGDYVIRNDRIVAVIADATPHRTANVKVKQIGGCVIDLTTREMQSDQLTTYFPGGCLMDTGWNLVRRFAYEALKVESDSGDEAIISVNAPTNEDGIAVRLRYTLRDGEDHLRIEITYTNNGESPISVEPVDEIRADRTFDHGSDKTKFFWVHDPWWEQAYGVVPHGGGVRRDSVRGHEYHLRYLTNDKTSISLEPGRSRTLKRDLICAPHLLGLRGKANRLAGTTQSEIELNVRDPHGPVPDAEIELSIGRTAYGSGKTDGNGRITFMLPDGDFDAEVTALGRPRLELPLGALLPDAPRPASQTIRLEAAGYVRTHITDAQGGPIPCKVQFIGTDGTKNPMFFPDCGEHGVIDCYYSHDGRFRQAIAPGRYMVIISRGPEYDAAFQHIEVKRGQTTSIAARLVRSVDTSGWVSTDFHSHSSPSGDNTSSQYGRVLNLLAEHVEFAPCTEHNRNDSYDPHILRLDAGHLLATAVGIELTGSPGTVNHQNAFPLLRRPRTQDGGGPLTDADPVKQIERLALWDDASDKLVQQNHPNLVALVYDGNLDGSPDDAYAKMVSYMDAIEIHPLSRILQPAIVRDGLNTGDNRIHTWLQMLNQGHRVPGVVNTDAHYNYHGSGGRRNYVKSATDDPARIKTLDIVHETEKGHVVMTTGPFMEVELLTASHRVIPGDLVRAGDDSELRIRVQCPNWFDIDRVQVLLNGYADPKLNFTRTTDPDRFGDGVVKFDQAIAVEFDEDTHVVVVAVAERSKLGPVMGPQIGARISPIAVSNPIYVDVDGDGFTPNGDPLDAPLPLR